LVNEGPGNIRSVRMAMVVLVVLGCRKDQGDRNGEEGKAASEADEQPKNKQPRTTPWPCRLQALDLQNRFYFQTREVARKTLNIASLRDMKVTVPSLSDQARLI
jgi:hypothetical protein